MLICSSFAIAGVYHGTGQHAWDISPSSQITMGLKVRFGCYPPIKYINVLQFWWLCEPFYVLSSMAIRASVCIMLTRLSVKHAHVLILWTNLAITELYGIAYFLLFIFQCLPSSYFWSRREGASGSCVEPSVIIGATYGYSIITCIGDLVHSVLPYYIVWELQMRKRERMAIVLILSMAAM